jgi:hypothetical protein
LPNEKDLDRPDCKAVFRLNREVAKGLRKVIRERLEKCWEEVKGTYTSKAKHPDWARLKDEINEKAYAERGIPRNLIGLELAMLEEASGAVEGGAITSEELPPEQGVVAPTEAATPLNDTHFDPLTPPHKWLRIDLTLPPLTFDPAESRATIDKLASDHAKLMNDAIVSRLKE